MPTPPHSLGPQRRIVECLSYSTPFPRSATEDGRAEDGPSSSAQGRGATLLAGPEPPTPSLLRPSGERSKDAEAPRAPLHRLTCQQIPRDLARARTHTHTTKHTCANTFMHEHTCTHWHHTYMCVQGLHRHTSTCVPNGGTCVYKLIGLLVIWLTQYVNRHREVACAHACTHSLAGYMQKQAQPRGTAHPHVLCKAWCPEGGAQRGRFHKGAPRTSTGRGGGLTQVRTLVSLPPLSFAKYPPCEADAHLCTRL